MKFNNYEVKALLQAIGYAMGASQDESLDAELAIIYSKIGGHLARLKQPIKNQSIFDNDPRNPLWRHMNEEHDLILLDSELQDIIEIVKEIA